MDNSASGLTEWMSGEVWAMHPKRLQTLARLARLEFERDLPAMLENARLFTELEALGKAKALESVSQRSRSIAVIPIFGAITKRDGIFSRAFGGASVDAITQSFRQAMADESVTSILLHIDSPGGSVQGIEELSAEIYSARKVKPVAAYADGMAASAAYWIASAAGEFVATPSADIGSIGVYGVHQDISRALDQMGITVSLISAGKYKTEGNPYEPLSDEARASFQSQVDDHYASFVSSLARNRSTTASLVKSNFGEGRTLGAKQAKAAGMIDRVETIDQTVKRMSSPGYASAWRAMVDAGQMADELLSGTPGDSIGNTGIGASPLTQAADSAALEIEQRRRRIRYVGA